MRVHQQRNATLDLWSEQAELVDVMLCQPGSHPFMQKLCSSLGLAEDGYADFVRRHQTNFRASLINARRNALSDATIPAITHRIWLTAQDNPKCPPEDYITDLFESYLNLPSYSVHYFWSNSWEIRTALSQKASALGCCNVIFADITLFKQDPIMVRVESLISARKFVLAGDMLKFVVLERFGGTYSDLGVIYDSSIFDLIQTADYGFIITDSVFFQTSLFASAPHADLTTMFLAIMNVPSALDPAYSMLEPIVTGLDEVHIFAGFGLTACAMLFLSPSSRALMLPGQSQHLRSRSQKSWYGEESKHGNVLVAQTTPTLIKDAEIQRAGELYRSNIKIYGNSPFLVAQMRVVLGTCDYFAHHPTSLCKNFLFHGSDKALHWHNYGFLYNFLFGRLKNEVRNILEIGIGTPYLDVSSTMGVTGVPGTSLRAWRESFPFAVVVGAGMDVQILFQEPRIETYWVDQARVEAIQSLFESIGNRQFDIIIDDGLHTFTANHTTVTEAYSYLTPGGLYVVEDVADEAVPAWNDYLASVGCVAVMIKLPHDTNHQDNRLILIPGGQGRCFSNARAASKLMEHA